jgi:hypothetical protein
LPIWLTAEDANGWRELWPDDELRVIAVDDLRDSDLLPQVDAEDMWVGLGVGRSAITCATLATLDACETLTSSRIGGANRNLA